MKIDDVTFQELNERWPFRRSRHGDVIDQIAPGPPEGHRVRRPVHRAEREAGAARGLRLRRGDPERGREGRAGHHRGQRARREQVPRRASRRPAGPRRARWATAGCRPTRAACSAGSTTASTGSKSLSVVAAEVATGRKVDPGQHRRRTARGSTTTGRPTRSSRSPSRAWPRARSSAGSSGTRSWWSAPTHPRSRTSTRPRRPERTSRCPASRSRRTRSPPCCADFPLKDAPAVLEVALIVLLGLAAPLASLRLSALWSLGLALALGVAFTIAAQLAFNSGTVIAFVYPLGTLVLAAVGALAVHLVTGAFERERIRDMFSRFVPENVVDEVLASTDGLRLGGVQREGTVMFSDLRGFTSFAEKLPGGAGDRDPQPLPDRDERRDPRPRRHAGGLHGRRHHGRLRRARAAGRPRRPRAGRRPRDARPAARRASTTGSAPRGSARASAWASGLNSGDGDVGQRRLRAAPRVHGDRRHHQHGRAGSRA